MSNLLVSIVTVTYNSRNTLSDTIKSVLSQTYSEIEYIIIDGASTDGTIDLINSYGKRISKFLSEPDDGIYDAINKGIHLAKGDILGILNSDDFFYDENVISKIVDAFKDEENVAVYGNVLFVKPNNTSRIIRKYSSRNFNSGMFKFGFMPAHPSFYAKREIFEKFGNYKTDYMIAADFDLLARFIFTHKIKCKYIDFPLVIMRTGGVSTSSLKNTVILNQEIKRACRENGIKTNFLFIYLKYFVKVFEFIAN